MPRQIKLKKPIETQVPAESQTNVSEADVATLSLSDNELEKELQRDLEHNLEHDLENDLEHDLENDLENDLEHASELDDFQEDEPTFNPSQSDYIIRQSQIANFQILSQFFAHDGKNITETLKDIQVSIDGLSKCVLHLNQTLSKPINKRSDS